MAKASEEISKYNSNSGGKTDSNLANDALHLGGIPAEEYATKKYVQDYHGTKEAAQKEYIDEQNKSKLEEAKAYTDQVVADQDFSKFAKLTDVQALDTKLTKKVDNDISNQKAYTDQQINSVVTDVNANFDDVNNAINALNSNQKELFQSVSNGKAKVAAAITDKGVTTASDATFDTMASNIKNISSGGGSIDPNYVNTSDATASASDILVGKMAYGQGQRIYGTLIAQAEAGMPTYGTDTSNATATAEDIAYGKTAYARGELLVGSMPKDTGIEEIYGTDDNGYSLEAQVAMINDSVTGDTISSRTHMTFSKNLDYCVSVSQLNSDTSTQYVESYAINENGLYIQQSGNVLGEISTKKYRYAKSDLGISEGETIKSLRLGSPGLDGDSKKCLLIIITSMKDAENSTYNNKLYLYTYHLTENGVIGKMYNNESALNINEVFSTTNVSYTYGLVTFNNKYDQFYILEYKYEMGDGSNLILYNYKISNNTLILVSTLKNSQSYTINVKDIRVSTDDKYITSIGQDYTLNVLIINDTSQTSYTPITLTEETASYGGSVYINGTNKYINGGSNALYLHTYGESTYITLNVEDASVKNLCITPDNKNLLVLTSSSQLKVFDIDTILAAENNTTIVPENTFTLSNFTITNSSMYVNTSGNLVLMYSQNSRSLYKLFSGLDSNNIIGIKYKDQYFYNIKSQKLTAGQGDVKTGKTFIGWMGYVETGTAEF